jgi:hypothetical protein
MNRPGLIRRAARAGLVTVLRPRGIWDPVGPFPSRRVLTHGGVVRGNVGRRFRVAGLR